MIELQYSGGFHFPHITPQQFLSWVLLNFDPVAFREENSEEVVLAGTWGSVKGSVPRLISDLVFRLPKRGAETAQAVPLLQLHHDHQVGIQWHFKKMSLAKFSWKQVIM